MPTTRPSDGPLPPVDRRTALKLLTALLLSPSLATAAAPEPVDERPRPPVLPPGSPLGDHFRVQGLSAVPEGRMIYVADEDRPDRPTRMCWACSFEDTARDAAVCAACGRPWQERRYIVSARCDRTRFGRWQEAVGRGIAHPGLASTVQVLVVDDVLYTVMPYDNQGIMADEASPIPDEQVLALAERVLEVSAHLHGLGVALERVTRSHILRRQDGSLELFDLDILVVKPSGAALEPAERVAVLPSLGALLESCCDVEAEGLARTARSARDGALTDAEAVGRGLAAHPPQPHPPRIGAISGAGLVRLRNTDAWSWTGPTPRVRVYAMADGLGVDAPGVTAATLAVRTVCDHAREHATSFEAKGAMDTVVDGMRAANAAVRAQGARDGVAMGTSLACVWVVDGKRTFVAQVGDVRVYLLRQGALSQITRDHSLVAKMVEAGRITAEEARNHEHRSILLRSIGTEKKVEIDGFEVALAAGDLLLLCSAGVWSVLDDRALEALLMQQADPRAASHAVQRAAMRQSGFDNLTAMVVKPS